MTQMEKLTNTLMSDLRARKWHRAIRCFHYAKSHHRGFRRDGVTPEFQHQVEIALLSLLLVDHLLYGEETICTVFLHDTAEDAGVEWSEVRSMIVGELPEVFGRDCDHDFASRVLFATERVTKVYRGVKKDFSAYLGEMTDPISSIVKMVDRNHNLGTMLGVFSKEKIAEQIRETEAILAMGKMAQNLHPEQFTAYMLVRTTIKDKIRMLTAAIQ